ncbi:MAG TPA: hypothetical protein VHL80_05830 [Polyangia bacterium]|nr:hypothetical protein [Polyangia bacterium]
MFVRLGAFAVKPGELDALRATCAQEVVTQVRQHFAGPPTLTAYRVVR